MFIQVFRCTLSVRLHSYQVRVAIDLHPRPTLQVLEVFRNVFQVLQVLQVFGHPLDGAT